MRVWGVPGGSGGSENHILKIFYRADSEIGTPGTPRGVPRDQKFFLKFFSEKVIKVYIVRFRGYYCKIVILRPKTVILKVFC